MNGEKVTIVSNIVELITNYFVAKVHVERDRKRVLMENNKLRMLPNIEERLLDGIP